MAKYFMGGTKYESYERLMMESPKAQRAYSPREKKKAPSQKDHSEKTQGQKLQ